MSEIWVVFFTFLKIGMMSFGGGYAVIPFIQSQIVSQNGWINETVFTDIITISQMTPGPLAVNTSTFVGLQVSGFFGALAATIGCVLCGTLLSLGLYRFMKAHQSSVYVMEVLNALKSASLGLIISVAGTIVLSALCDGEVFNQSAWKLPALTMFVLLLAALRKWKLHPILVMGISGVIGLLVYQ